MRLVVAVLRPSQLEAVRQALAAVHVTRLTVCDAQGIVATGATSTAAGIAQEAVMEIAVNDDFLERTIDTLRAATQHDVPAADDGGLPQPGCRLFVLPIEEAVQIYRDVRGQEAL